MVASPPSSLAMLTRRQAEGRDDGHVQAPHCATPYDIAAPVIEKGTLEYQLKQATATVALVKSCDPEEQPESRGEFRDACEEETRSVASN